MAITTEFKEAVLQNKITRIRIMLKDSLLLDPSGDDFLKMFEYAKQQIPSLLDEHDGEIFVSEDEWNEEYLNEQMVGVINNFSQERIDLLRKIVYKLYNKADINKKSASEKKDSYVSTEPARSGLSSTQKVGVAVSTVGIATLVGGIVAQAPVIVPIIGGVVLATGGVLIITGKEK